MYIDSHCHLQHTFSQEGIMQFLKSNNLSYLVDISTNMDEFFKIKQLDLPKQILFAFGLYPEIAPNFSKQIYNNFTALAEKFPPNAIGEVGLDYHWDYGTPKQQETLFRSQIEYSIEKNLPLIIHSRDAFNDTYRILKSYDFSIPDTPITPVIMHCFGYGPDEVEEFLAMNCIISFAGNLTYKKAHNLHDAAKIVPIDKLLLETDSPYLTPVPLRGKKNHPANVEHVYRYIAELKSIDVEKLLSVVENTFESIFDLC